MPRKLLDRFPAPATSRYPWDELLDGNPWELIAGVDFMSKPNTFVSNARTQAKRRGGSVRTRLFENGTSTTIVLQFMAAS